MSRIRNGICTGMFVLGIAAQSGPAQLRVNLGVFGGQIHDIAAYDDGGTTEVLIAVRSQKSIYRQTATGWQAVFEGGVEGEAIEADVSPGNAGIVWASINEQLYIHEPSSPWDNSGWTLNTAIAHTHVLVGHETGMYVGSGSRVYRSTDGGKSFTTLIDFGGDEALSLSVFNETLFYAVAGEIGNAKLYRCEDSGAGFVAGAVPVSAGSASVVDFEQVGVDPLDLRNAAAPSRFFVAGNSAEGNVYRTEDGGASWTRLGLGTMDGYPQYIRFTDFGGGRRVFISSSYSDDYGDTWSSIPNLSSSTGLGAVLTHANDGAIAFDPNDPDVVYIDTDWAIGAWNMKTGAATESKNAEGIEGVILGDIAQIQTDAITKATVWIASKSGLGKTTSYPSTSSGSDWLFPIFPQDDGSPPSAVAIHPDDLDIVLVGNFGGAVYRTTNGGPNAGSWSRSMSLRDATFSGQYTTPDRARITDVKILSSDPNIVYACAQMIEGAYEGGVYWSQDNGVTWQFDFTDTGGAAINVPVNALMVLPDAVWAGVGTEADTRSEARGLYARFSVILDDDWWQFPTGTDLDSEVVRAIDGTRVGSTYTVYVATTGGVYRGELDSAATSTWTWTQVSPNGSQRYAAAAVNPSDPNEVYVAHDNYIWASFDGGATWGVVPPSGTSTHEEVLVLLFDDLLVGTANGLFAPTQEALDMIGTDDGPPDDEMPDDGDGEDGDDDQGDGADDGDDSGGDDSPDDPTDPEDGGDNADDAGDSTDSDDENHTDDGNQSGPDDQTQEPETDNSGGNQGTTGRCGFGAVGAVSFCLPLLGLMKAARRKRIHR